MNRTPVRPSREGFRSRCYEFRNSAVAISGRNSQRNSVVTPHEGVSVTPAQELPQKHNHNSKEKHLRLLTAVYANVSYIALATATMALSSVSFPVERSCLRSALQHCCGQFSDTYLNRHSLKGVLSVSESSEPARVESDDGSESDGSSHSHESPPKHLLEQGLADDDRAYLLCARCEMPVVVDLSTEDDDPHDCFCDDDLDGYRMLDKRDVSRNAGVWM